MQVLRDGRGRLIAASPIAFLVRRWRGEVPAGVLFWRDMLAVGTAINLGCSLLALILVSQGVSLGLAVTVHFAPVPYNLFLFAALIRMPSCGRMTAVAAAVWLAAMTLV